jgi:hypothetical protein
VCWPMRPGPYMRPMYCLLYIPPSRVRVIHRKLFPNSSDLPLNAMKLLVVVLGGRHPLEYHFHGTIFEVSLLLEKWLHVH